MKKVLLGLSDNVAAHADKIRLWANSFRAHADGDVVLLAANTNADDLDVCKTFGVDCVSVDVPRSDQIWHKRFEPAVSYLKTAAADVVICTDVFDVAFQGNPFLKLQLDEFDFFVGGEGLLVQHEPWNVDNIGRLFPEQLAKCLPLELTCCGVFGGKKDAVIHVCERMLALAESGLDAHSMRDQAALNVMIANNEIPKLKRFNLADGWVAHCHVSGPTSFFVSQGYRDNLKYEIPQMLDGVICTAAGQPYDIVHQFNRVPAWHEILQARYA
jgi:hypothetical protein